MTKDDLFNRVARFITNIHDFETSLSSQRRDDNVTALQFELLQVLYFSGPKNLSGLSNCTNINLPNCSREVKKLTNLGYISKESSPEDKRRTELSLSDSGREKMDSSLLEMKNLFFEGDREWSDERIERCIKSITVLEDELFHL